MTGASGAAYAVRLLDVLLGAGCEVHLVISPAATQVMQQELGISLDLKNFSAELLLPSGGLQRVEQGGAAADGASVPSAPPAQRGALTYHHYEDFSAGIASGSFLTTGMVICPCSMGTLAAISAGHSSNLIQRAADVHLKERRKLIVVPRETPLGSIQLENMKRLSDAGGVILPAMPGFYHNPRSIEDLVDFVVARICDQLGIGVKLTKRWGEAPSRQSP